MHRPVSGDFLQWLQTFVKVSETGNLHRAATLRYVTPSAASLHIKKLEEDLGFKLFVRKNKGMVLTQAGSQFHSACLPILQALENLRSNKELKPVLRGPVRITCINRLAHYVVPAIVEFRKLNPDVSFNLDLTAPRRVLRHVEEGIVDFAVSIYSQLPGHLKFARIRPSSAFLYAPPGNPFQLSSKPTWDEICELPFISLTLEGYVNPVVSVLPGIRSPKNIVVAINDFLLALQLVKAGVGVCISPPLTPLESANDYTLINIDHIFPIGTLGIIFRWNSFLSVQAKEFMNFFIKKYSIEE